MQGTCCTEHHQAAPQQQAPQVNPQNQSPMYAAPPQELNLQQQLQQPVAINQQQQ